MRFVRNDTLWKGDMAGEFNSPSSMYLLELDGTAL